jgi:hypothetical protein
MGYKIDNFFSWFQNAQLLAHQSLVSAEQELARLQGWFYLSMILPLADFPQLYVGLICMT